LSSELKALDFDYVGLPDLLQRARLGGRVEFQRHQSGAWIVAYWHIRMPVIDSVTVRGTGNTRVAVPRVVSYVEQGGRAEITTRSASAIVNHALVRGTVVDSTVASAPGLPGTVVWVEGFADSARTDSLGRFELAVPMYGSRTVLADHPRLRLLGEAPSKDVRLSLGDTVPVSFATPSIQTVARRSCGRSGNRAGLIGQTWDTAGSARAGMELRVRAAVAQGWREEYSWRTFQPGTFGRPSFEQLLPAAEALIRLVDEYQASIKIDASPERRRSHPERRRSHPERRRRIDVMGFSQGAAMSSVLAYLYPERIRKVGILSGFVPSGMDEHIDRRPLDGKNIFVAHGTKDETVPVDRAHASMEILKRCGAEVVYCEDEVGHKVSLNCLRALRSYLED
jgi:hypothetical protein